jgi:hypothetical protein
VAASGVLTSHPTQKFLASVAETHYRQALTLAEELGMRRLVAHCHRGLWTLSPKIGRRAETRAELSAAVEL